LDLPVSDPQSSVLNPQPSSAPFGAEEEIDLAEYIGVIVDGYRWIIAIAITFLLVAAAYAFIATPIYQADALLQVEQKKSGLGGMADLDTLLTGEAPADAEIEIIRSRSVLGKVVENLQLDLSVKPHYFPIIGRWMARGHEQDEHPVAAFLGMRSFAWGGEHIRMDRLHVPNVYHGEPLTLIAGKQGAYRLVDGDGKLLLEGVVGRRAGGKKAERDDFSAFVSELVAEPGTRFDVVKQRWLTVVQGLQTVLNIAEKGKKTGMLQMTLEDRNPAYAVSVLNEAANVYLRQNVERKSEEAKNALIFLQGQLPQIKAELEAAETKLNSYRLERGSVDVGLEVQGMLNQSVELERQLSEISLQKAELERRFTSSHPMIQALNAKISRLQSERKKMEGKVKTLPETEQEVLRLMRDVKVQTELYTLLLNKVQELKVAKAGTIGNVRILDYAVIPDKPIKPKKGLIIALGLVLGLFVGVLFVFIRKSLQKGIESPELIEQKLGIPVYATVPHAEAQIGMHEQMRKHKGKGGDFLLASVNDSDMAVESLRSLRTNLHFGLMDAKNNIVMISGPAPGVGKSFVSANLAHVLATAGKRVLLIDADLRKGHLFEYFGLNRAPGLSECICGDMELELVVNKTAYDGLDVLTTGQFPPNPSELLMSEHFENLLAEASKAYDLVLIDTPPVLAVTDAVVIGKLAGTAFLLLRAGRHPIQEIQQAVRHLEHGGVKLQGTIFNGLKPKRSKYGYGYGYGGYQYEYKKEDK